MFIFVWAFFSFVSSDWRFIFLLIMVLLIHELGHLFSMKLFKYTSIKMLFIPFLGALVQGEKERYSQRQRVIVLLSGPVPGVLLGVFCIYSAGFSHNFWMMYAGLLFVIINILNLLPIDPLDGGQLVQVLFFSRKELYQFVFAFISSIALIFIGYYFGNWWLIFFGFIMGIRVRAYQKLFHIRNDLKEENVEFSKHYNDLTNKEYHQIRQIFLKHSPSASRIVKYEVADHVALEEILSNEVNNILESPTSKDINLKWKVFFCLIWLSALSLTVWILWREMDHLTWFINAFQDWR
jgi:Zn-dependent protease